MRREWTLRCGEGVSFAVEAEGSYVHIGEIHTLFENLQKTLDKVSAIRKRDLEKRVEAEVEARLAAHQGIYR